MSTREEAPPVTYITRTRGDRMRFLAEALRSVAGQTRPARSLVVVDKEPGPERERVVEAVREIAARERVMLEAVVCSEESGYAGPWNAGLALVTTPYVAALDDDDVVYGLHAAGLAGALDADREAGVAHGWIRLYRCDKETNHPRERKLDMGAPFTPAELKTMNRVPVHGAIVRTEVARLEPWRRGEGPCCDWGFWLRLMFHRGVGFRHVDALVGEYRIRTHEDSNGATRAEMLDYTARVRSRWAESAPAATPA